MPPSSPSRPPSGPDRYCTLGIVSDIHYAGAAEQARGRDYESRGIPNPLLRFAAKQYRHHIWLRDPLGKNYLLDDFIKAGDAFDYVIANGDFSCNTAFVGVSDDAACASAQECLGKLRRRFGNRLRTTYGDHEFGKMSMFGGHGGMRMASLHRARTELDLPTFWTMTLGRYTLIGVTSSLIALPVFEKDTLVSEKSEWQKQREEQLTQIRETFAALAPNQKVLLFCHDPTALPFLWREPAVQSRIAQIEQTIIGHLHTDIVLWESRWLAGMPPIHFLGNTARRLSTALNEARHWRPFNVRLCPSLAGVELLKRGGYLTARLDLTGEQSAQFTFHRVRRRD